MPARIFSATENDADDKSRMVSNSKINGETEKMLTGKSVKSLPLNATAK